jgi:hypothetical protein
MTRNTEQERAEFEAWWRGYTKSTKAPRFEGGAYIFPAANTAWNTWQAALRVQVVPDAHPAEGVQSSLADALDAARYRFLRDTCWSSDKELATVISLQMNKVGRENRRSNGPQQRGVMKR